MAYNRENLLRRIIEIQDVVLESQRKGIPQKRIYDEFIKDRYHISYSCFNKYLGINAKQKLKIIEN
jgi:hypothetical protein